MALTTPALIQALAASEGFRAAVYDDKQPWLELAPGDEDKVKGTLTYGHGLTQREDGTPLQIGDRITFAKSMERIARYVREVIEPVLENIIHVPLAPHQYDALAHAMYQYGGPEMSGWRLIRLINDDAPWTEIVREWVNGTVMFMGEPLFWSRRVKEVLMFLGLDWRAARNIPVGSSLPDAARALGFAGNLPRGSGVTFEDPDLTIPPLRRVDPDLPAGWDRMTENEKTHYLNTGELIRIGGDPATPGPDRSDRPAPPVRVEPAPDPAPVIGTKAPSAYTVKPEEVPYRIDPNAGLKPMVDSQRYAGQFLVTLGVLLKANSNRLLMLPGLGGVAVSTTMAMMDNPATMAILASAVAAAIGFGVWIVGKLTEAHGEKVRQRGEETATQGMY